MGAAVAHSAHFFFLISEGRVHIGVAVELRKFFVFWEDVHSQIKF